MAIPVLLILAVLWAAVLIPPLLKARTDHRSTDSIGDFRYRLGVLGRTGGHESPLRSALVADNRQSPRGPSAATRRRRRDVLLVLLGVALLSAAGALATGSVALWVLHVFVDLVAIAYVALLVRIRQLASERETKVRYLPQAPSPRLALRRTVSS